MDLEVDVEERLMAEEDELDGWDGQIVACLGTVAMGQVRPAERLDEQNCFDCDCKGTTAFVHPSLWVEFPQEFGPAVCSVAEW